MYHRPDTEALIIGAGPIGLCHAVHLRECGVGVRIFDEEWRTAAHSYALALHPRSLEILEGLELVEAALEQGHRVDRLAFYEGGERKGELSLAELPGPHPFALVMPQSLLEQLLEQRLADKGVSVEWNNRICDLRIEDDRIRAVVGRLAPEFRHGHDLATTEWIVEDTFELHPHFVIGADGHRSVARRTLGIECASYGEPELFGVFEFECGDLEPEVRVVFHEGTTNVLWPLPGGHGRWSFQLPPEDGVEQRRKKARLAVHVGRRAYPHLSEDDLRGLLRERAPWFDESSLGEIEWSTVVRFERKLAERLGRGHVWLAGDAAHQTGPVGVHSMNVAMREACDLTARICEILADRASLATLDDYDQRWRSEWRCLLGDVDVPAAGWAARNLARVLACVPASGADLRRLVRQIGVQLPDDVTV